jgi:hypothetical protein
VRIVRGALAWSNRVSFHSVHFHFVLDCLPSTSQRTIADNSICLCYAERFVGLDSFDPAKQVHQTITCLSRELVCALAAAKGPLAGWCALDQAARDSCLGMWRLANQYATAIERYVNLDGREAAVPPMDERRLKIWRQCSANAHQHEDGASSASSAAPAQEWHDDGSGESSSNHARSAATSRVSALHPTSSCSALGLG